MRDGGRTGQHASETQNMKRKAEKPKNEVNLQTLFCGWFPVYSYCSYPSCCPCSCCCGSLRLVSRLFILFLFLLVLALSVCCLVGWLVSGCGFLFFLFLVPRRRAAVPASSSMWWVLAALPGSLCVFRFVCFELGCLPRPASHASLLFCVFSPRVPSTST